MFNVGLTTKPLIRWLTSMLMNVHYPATGRSRNCIYKINFNPKAQSFYLQHPQTPEELKFPIVKGLTFWQKGRVNNFTIISPVDLVLFGEALTGAKVEITSRGRNCVATLAFNKTTYDFIARPISNAGQPMLISTVDVIKLSQGKTVPDLRIVDNFGKCISYNLLKLADV